MASKIDDDTKKYEDLPLYSLHVFIIYFIRFRCRSFGGTFKKHTTNIAIWGGYLTLSLIVFFALSSRDFSFLLVRSQVSMIFRNLE